MRRTRSKVLILFAVAGISSPLFAESAPSSPSLQPSSTLSGPSSSGGMTPVQPLSGSKDILKHEPLWMEGLRFGHRNRIDFGMDFGLDMFHPEGVDSSDFNVSYLKLGGHMGYRYAPNKRVQISLKAPLLFQLFTYGGTSGVLLEDDSSAGLGQVQVGAKAPLTPNFGVQAVIELPTGSPDKTPALGEGTNLGVLLLAEAGRGPVAIHGSVGKIIKQEYAVTPEGATTSTDQDPGDVTVVTVALTSQGGARPGRARMGQARTTQVGSSLEIQHFMIEESAVNGTKVPDTDGAATSLILGLTVGSESMATTNLFKFGVFFGIGEESHQSFDTIRGVGDFGYFLTGSVRWGELQ